MERINGVEIVKNKIKELSINKIDNKFWIWYMSFDEFGAIEDAKFRFTSFKNETDLDINTFIRKHKLVDGDYCKLLKVNNKIFFIKMKDLKIQLTYRNK